MEKNKIRKIIFIILSIACMVVIFMFSADNADASSKKSGTVVKVVVENFVEGYEEMPVEEQESIFSKVSFWVRKTAHFTIYMALGFCISGTYKKLKLVTPHTLVSLVICFLYACSDEFHQSFSPGRGPQFRDVMIDTSGALMGILIFSLLAGIVTLIFSKGKKRIIIAEKSF